MSRAQMLKFSNEQALALQVAFAPIAPALVPPPSMQPMLAQPGQQSLLEPSSLSCSSSSNSYELCITSRSVLSAYIVVVFGLALCDIVSPRSMQVVATAATPVIIIALAAHASLASPAVSFLGLSCALLYPLPLLAASAAVSWGYCAALGLFFAASALQQKRSGLARLAAWVCLAALVLTSVLLSIGVRGRTLWAPVLTMLCIQAALALWARGPMRILGA